ncbi:CobN component of cobalt chelatase involved in B12 biosynthesis [Acidisarcina polymorpha]|uniref:CobN component of cobalt chelatase involved in B12 biosynthesis n=1 Tax=Acidisarcina polymorpha TaxID=2211140 RepID=A0A2Z5G5N9_9BACT|nr:cobaltochelatase subunit CobN [Acidisarcina polymorpha]AXC14411.1 CobN component of cobalt chelatase involved in B12 biosynthesis [Acidisarcina polymorpha]
MSLSHRQRVIRADGRAFNIIQHRAHLTYCYSGCCCGITERGYAAIPVEVYTEEWLRRKIRNQVHLTKGGCLGPCALANVVSLVFDGKSVWFHSVNSAWLIRQIFDYIDAMLAADRFLQPQAELSEYVFNYYDWDVRTPPSTGPQLAPSKTAPASGIMLLSHADTDLLTLMKASEILPPELRVGALSLNALRTEEQLEVLLQAELGQARIIVVRCHGPLHSIPGYDRLRAACIEGGKSLVLVSGCGENSSEFSETINVPADVLETAGIYLSLGGVANFAELFRCLSDRLMLTGYGYAPPSPTPEHGIYLPDIEVASIEDWVRQADAAKPTVAVLFYRAHRMSGNTGFIDTLALALQEKGVNALCVFTSSLKAKEDGRPAVFKLIEGRASVLISTLSFALGEVNTGTISLPGTALESLSDLGIPVVQAIACQSPRGAWEGSRRGLNAVDTAVNVAIPEFDGRIISVPVSFKELHGGNTESLYVAHEERVERVAGIASRLAALRRISNRDRRVAFVLTNSAAKASQVGGAVGLDTPASLLITLQAMRARRYAISPPPETSDEFMQRLLQHGTYDGNYPLDPAQAKRFSRAAYRRIFSEFPERPARRMQDFWGQPQDHGPSTRPAKKTDKKLLPTIGGKIVSIEGEEPWADDQDYLFAAMEIGNALIALQPPRGYGIDPDAIYHTPDLPPTHHYTAFYRWLGTPQAQGGWGADAIVHMGKHGTLEWLPGKGVGLSGECYPDLLLGDLPLIYPFIINDPGEGSQSKRRAHAVIVDHLTPPMTLAETYGPLAELNQLVNEYYSVEKLDPVKLPYLQQQIWELVQRTNLRADLDLKTMLTRERGDHTHEWDDALTPEGIPATLASMNGNEVAHLIEDLDGYLCELGMAQIRDGLHVLGQMPPPAEMLRSLTRLSNFSVPGLQSSLAAAFGFDLSALLDHAGKRLEQTREILGQSCHTGGDVLEAIERAALDLFTMLESLGFRSELIGEVQRAVLGIESADIASVLSFACNELVPKLEQSGDEIEHLLDALEGKYVPAGPAGAPTRGMAHILPSGRNFYAVDPRALPSQAAWRVGQQLAREAIERFHKEEHKYPEMMGLSVWGTSQMRTHGDDIAEAFALLGVEPLWNAHSRRLEGVSVVPLEQLGRPRVDVTLRISGFFRDAFRHLIEMFDHAVSLVVELDEPVDQNFPRKHYLDDLKLSAALPAHEAEAQARYRIFGSRPGSYGAGILPLIETGNWQSDGDFARAFLAWGGYAYGKGVDGVDAQPVFTERLKSIQVALHNQDNREHDIFDSDDYFQFHGGMIASIRALTGTQPKAYFGDSSRPESAQVRDLREEALRVYRSRVVNPKWIESIKRHGYKGGLELAATVDYIFGFDATAQIAPDFVYEGLAEHYALAPEMRDFLATSNPWALNAIAERLLEAAKRELWEHPAPETLAALRGVLLDSEALLEAQGERKREAVS